MTELRLAKFLAATTPLSRRSADVAIAAGEVMVNGKRAATAGMSVVPGRDQVTYRGQRLRLLHDPKVILLYKPKQCVVTRHDPQGRHTIWDLLPLQYQKFEAVGRLDYDSEGLLLLTNDGTLLNQLTHPRYHLTKRYAVKLGGTISPRQLEKIVTGITDSADDDETLSAESATLLPVKAPRKGSAARAETEHTWIEVVLTEGKYRQIRRMCEHLGYEVLKLKRTAIGAVHLPKTLLPGKLFKLPPAAIRSLMARNTSEKPVRPAKPGSRPVSRRQIKRAPRKSPTRRNKS